MLDSPIEYNIQADREAEDALIACCLVDETAPTRMLELVRPGDMETTPAKEAYERIARAVAEGKPVGMHTIGGGLVTPQWMGDILRVSMTVPQAVPYWAEYVRRAAQTRAVIRASEAAIKAALEGADPGETARLLTESLSSIRSEERIRTRTLLEVMNTEGYPQMVEWMENPGRLAGPSTGIKRLDTYLGGMGPGRLIMLGADTGVGKTLFVQHLARACAVDLVPVHVVSTEMSDSEVFQRFAFMEAGWDKLKVQQRGHVRDEEKGDMLDGLEELAHRPILLTELRGMNIDALEAEVHRVRTAHGTRLLIVDLLNGLKTEGENRAQGIAQNTARLKQMAEREGVCLVVTAHINRDSAKGIGELGLHSFKDSSAIEQDADQALLLVPVSSDGERMPREEVAKLVNAGHAVDVSVVICKNRHGAEGRVRVKLNWGHGGRFYPVEAA